MNSAQSQCNRACLVMFFLATTARSDVPSFVTRDSRLPNPERPYDMISGTVHFLLAHDFGLYDIQFAPTNTEQLDFLEFNDAGQQWEFDSKFDIAYETQVSFGLGPVHRVIGTGTAHLRGAGPADTFPWVLDTELVELNLTGLSSRPGDFLLRESPTVRSGGKITLEDACPQCDSPFPIWRMSSFLDIYAEASADGGQTWVLGDKPFRVVQQDRPVVLGDFNENGIVDAADYVVWRKRLGPGALPNEGGVSNNVVDEADYQFWRSRFGATADVPFSPVFSVTVPEPSTVVLLTIAATISIFSDALWLAVSKKRKLARLENEKTLQKQGFNGAEGRDSNPQPVSRHHISSPCRPLMHCPMHRSLRQALWTQAVELLRHLVTRG